MRRFLQIFWIALLFAPAVRAETINVPLSDPAATESFYAARQGEPLWVYGPRLSLNGKTLLDVLRRSWENGLNPESYHVAEIDALFGENGPDSQLNEANALSLELLMTDAYVRYARDLSGMRVNAKDLAMDPAQWRQKIEPATALDALAQNTAGIAPLLASFEPQTQTYQRLKAELKHLVVETKDEDDPVPLKFEGIAKPGKGYADMPKLRERFGLPDVSENEMYTYDDALAAKIMEFQAERGLKPDGMIGERTLFALNLTRRDKIHQLVVNLERLRWVPQEKPKRFIVVNMPSAMLWAIDDGKIAHEMPVIVGRPKRATPVFITQIHGVRFNPTWTVPPTIKKEDILPELRKDPAHLLDKGMELFEGSGEEMRTVDPMSVDWTMITEKEMSRYRMVQIPGAHNPLGTVRVLMPNPQNIYLHDTNHPTMFEKYDRALSSGCVRMKDPEKIADFILSYQKGWKTEKIKELIDKGKTKDLYVDEKMPVFLLYYTAWVDHNGGVVYGMDIYDHDKKLRQLIEKVDGFSI